MRRRRAATDSHDRGSVAVEFALLLPVLLLIIFGTIDFGRAINAQITLTQAAREGARLASLGYTSSAVTTRTQSAATGLSNVTVTVTTCAAGAGAVFTFGLKGGYDAGIKLVSNVKLFSHLANIGDTRSLIIHPASTTHRQLSDAQKVQAGAGPDVVRLSIGIEDKEDIIADLEQALAD